MTSANGAVKLSPNPTVNAETVLLRCPHCRSCIRLALVSAEPMDCPDTPKVVSIAPAPESGLSDDQDSQPITVTLATVEKRAILAALSETGNDKPLAARMLGIGKTTLYRKLRAYGSNLSETE